MAHYNDARVYLDQGDGNYVDLTEYVQSIEVEDSRQLEAAVEEALSRVFRREPMTITLDWKPGREYCPLCGLGFVPSADQPVPHVSINGGPDVPCCDACAVQHLIA